MEREFNKNLILENISYLLKTGGLKIGELEAKLGVSAGYISRISKSDGPTPGIDFLCGLSKIYEVALDQLLFTSLSKNENSEYLLKFISKLYTDTLSNDLEWKVEKKNDLHNIKEYNDNTTEHPMFKSGGKVGYIYFPSETFGEETYINGDCYKLSMKNYSTLYIMNISNINIALLRNAKVTATYELWMQNDKKASTFLCSSNDDDYKEVIENLYKQIQISMKHPKLEKDIKYIIDSYLNNNDLSGDDSLPF